MSYLEPIALSVVQSWLFFLAYSSIYPIDDNKIKRFFTGVVFYYITTQIFFTNLTLIFGVICLPIILGLLTSICIKHNLLNKLFFNKINLNLKDTCPTSWDFMFYNRGSCFLTITLKNGSTIHGEFDENSFVGDSKYKDIYIKKINKGNRPYIYINKDEISLIEFTK